MSTEMKPMSLGAFAKLWYCDAEFEPDPEFESRVIIWEPLDTDAPLDARPYVYGLGEIDFYDRGGNRTVDRRVKFHQINDSFPNLVLLRDDVWREVMPGRVVVRNGFWYVRHTASSNTRAAKMMNAGFKAYLER